MKLVKSTMVDPTELYLMLSKSEALTLEDVIYRRIQSTIEKSPCYQEVDTCFNYSFWLQLKPHFIHFSLDIHILECLEIDSHKKWKYRDEFDGKLEFFSSLSEFILAREIFFLSEDPNYVRYN